MTYTSPLKTSYNNIIIMPQIIVFLDEEENTKVEKVAYKLRLSKQEAIKKIIREVVVAEQESEE